MESRHRSATGPAEPPGPAEWFARRALRNPADPAISFQDRTWTYGEFQTLIESVADALASGGAQRGSRIAWLGFNHPLTLAVMFAANRIGAIFVPLNYRLSPRELKECVDDAGIHTIVADASHTHLIDEIGSGNATSRFIVTDEVAPPGWHSLEKLMTEASPAQACAGKPDDIAIIAFTSGTTGRAKGAMLTNANIYLTNINWSLSHGYRDSDVTIVSAPFFHVGGLFVNLTPTLMWGGHAIIQQHFDALAFMREVERYRVTITFMVPATMLMVSQHPEFETIDLSSLRLIVQGGAPAPRPLLALYGERGIPVSNCYGMSEATGAVTLLDPREAISRLGSCGRPGMLTSVRLVDAAGLEITSPGERGEVLMKGGGVMAGYWERPDATAAAFDADGWLRSGDIGYFDEEGYLYICDRLKDMLISGGENVYPAELESLFHGHPAIAEVAVIGAPDEKWGERVVAIAALKPGSELTLEDLRAFCEGQLARFKLPRELHLVDALPRNANGKIQKGELRSRFVSSGGNA
ncbi:MAG: long-chain fatty acid--CoA ligase [Rhodobiaceae bacterium]|nr:long-chain fatty acid--CoA ligase [Rhodobiaceae bacterium]MCC0056005.1 long-chain fatty acid--CoA ligase [Rhodobiaceae bacterium]